jgi:hypothetical protein
MPECEDCGDDCQRRTRCPHCGQLVCGWCYSHVHGPQLELQAFFDGKEKEQNAPTAE